jgi:hypothetical protein
LTPTLLYIYEVPGIFLNQILCERLLSKELVMSRRKKHTPQQVVNLLRQIEVAVANGKTTVLSCKEAEITEQTYYRWRKK